MKSIIVAAFCLLAGAASAAEARAVLRHLATPAAKAAFTAGGVE